MRGNREKCRDCEYFTDTTDIFAWGYCQQKKAMKVFVRVDYKGVPKHFGCIFWRSKTKRGK